MYLIFVVYWCTLFLYVDNYIRFKMQNFILQNIHTFNSNTPIKTWFDLDSSEDATYLSMLLFFNCPPVPFFFSLLSHDTFIFSFISKTMLEKAQILKALCRKFCFPLLLFHFEAASLLMKLGSLQVGLCPACSLLYPLFGPILIFSSPDARNNY